MWKRKTRSKHIIRALALLQSLAISHENYFEFAAFFTFHKNTQVCPSFFNIDRKESIVSSCDFNPSLCNQWFPKSKATTVDEGSVKVQSKHPFTTFAFARRAEGSRITEMFLVNGIKLII